MPGNIEAPQTLNPFVYAAANPTRYTDPTGGVLLPALAPAVVKAAITFAAVATAATAGHLAYQAYSGPRAFDYAPLDYSLDVGRAVGFGAATGGIAASAVTLGASGTLAGAAIGGGLSVGDQTLVGGRSLSEVDWEAVYRTGGIGAGMGAGFQLGATSASAGWRFVSRLALTDRAWFGETDRDLGVIGVGELSMVGVASVVRPN